MPHVPSQSQVHPEQLSSCSSSNPTSDTHIKSESSDDSLTAAGVSGAANVAHSQVDQSAPITSQPSSQPAAVVASSSRDAVASDDDAVCSAPGTKLHAA